MYILDVNSSSVYSLNLPITANSLQYTPWWHVSLYINMWRPVQYVAHKQYRAHFNMKCPAQKQEGIFNPLFPSFVPCLFYGLIIEGMYELRLSLFQRTLSMSFLALSSKKKKALNSSDLLSIESWAASKKRL